MVYSQYYFSAVDSGKTYARQLYGFEALCNQYAVYDGAFWFNGSCHMKLAGCCSQEALEPHLVSAWIQLRRIAPAIALRSYLNERKHEWKVVYNVPQTPTDSRAWANQTIIWGNEEKPILDHDVGVADGNWDYMNGDYGIKLFANPVRKKDGQWFLSISAPHGLMDGRGSTFLFDALLGILNESLTEGYVGGIDNIQWGEEVQRLTAAPPILTGVFNDYIGWATAKSKERPANLPPESVLFLPPYLENKPGRHTLAVRLVALDKTQTARFRAVCSSRGETVTNVVDSIMTLADLEAILNEAKMRGGEHFDKTLKLFKTATHRIIPLTFKDRRPDYPEHSKLSSARGAALYAIDGHPLVVDMAKVRQILAYDQPSQCSTESRMKAFWKELVPFIQYARKSELTGQANYIKREAAYHEEVPACKLGTLATRSITLSSVGHVEAYGALAEFTPSAAEATGKKVQALDLLIRVKGITPMTAVAYWQFDDRLNFYFPFATRWRNEQEMDVMAEAFKKWVNLVMDSGD